MENGANGTDGFARSQAKQAYSAVTRVRGPVLFRAAVLFPKMDKSRGEALSFVVGFSFVRRGSLSCVVSIARFETNCGQTSNTRL